VKDDAKRMKSKTVAVSSISYFGNCYGIAGWKNKHSENFALPKEKTCIKHWPIGKDLTLDEASLQITASIYMLMEVIFENQATLPSYKFNFNILEFLEY